jgi:hypothetical protein
LASEPDACSRPGQNAHRCSAQFMGSEQLCKICRPECHNVVKGAVTRYRLEQQYFAGAAGIANNA